MPNLAGLPPLSVSSLQLAREIIATLNQRGHIAYLVGGCVRDRLLGLTPKDFDVSTDATHEVLRGLFPNAQLVGAHFGVVLVKAAPDVHVEVATFRKEGEYSDGRRPDDVQFVADPRLDAQRRDFTINGLFEDVNTRQVHDFVNGQRDLSGKLIRAIGDPELRFKEDHLRMLRAVRFAARFGFELESQTLDAIRRFAPKIVRVSAERIRDELVRILVEGGARRGFELLDETGLLELVLPEVKAFQAVEQPPQFHPEGDVWNHVLLMLEKMNRPSTTLALGVLLHDVGKPATFRRADRIRFDGHAEVGAALARKILSRLKLSADDTEQVVSLVANHMKFKDVRQMRLATLKRFLRLPQFGEHLELHRLDTAASNGYTDAYNFVNEQLSAVNENDLRPPRLLTGRDLIAAGHAPGPNFARALEAVESAQLEGTITTQEEAMSVAEAALTDTRFLT